MVYIPSKTTTTKAGLFEARNRRLAAFQKRADEKKMGSVKPASLTAPAPLQETTPRAAEPTATTTTTTTTTAPTTPATATTTTTTTTTTTGTSLLKADFEQR
jgi:hypothetical protein